MRSVILSITLCPYGLHGSQSTALVIEVLRAALAAYGVPAEILTDNGTQYVTWRGKGCGTGTGPIVDAAGERG